MTDRPEPIVRLHTLLSASLIAHRTIYNLHRQLVIAESSTPSLGFVHESADIALREMDAIASEARRLAERWSEASVLRPDAARATLVQFEFELKRVEPRLRELLDHQVEIARELQSRLRR